MTNGLSDQALADGGLVQSLAVCLSIDSRVTLTSLDKMISSALSVAREAREVKALNDVGPRFYSWRPH